MSHFINRFFRKHGLKWRLCFLFEFVYLACLFIKLIYVHWLPRIWLINLYRLENAFIFLFGTFWFRKDIFTFISTVNSFTLVTVAHGFWLSIIYVYCFVKFRNTWWWIIRKLTPARLRYIFLLPKTNCNTSRAFSFLDSTFFERVLFWNWDSSSYSWTLFLLFAKRLTQHVTSAKERLILNKRPSLYCIRPIQIIRLRLTRFFSAFWDMTGLILAFDLLHGLVQLDVGCGVAGGVVWRME